MKEPQWYCHRGNRVFGRELESGELIDMGDVYASNRLGWFATTYPGQKVPEGKRYIRPFPAPKWHLLCEQMVYGRMLARNERAQAGDLPLSERKAVVAGAGEILLGGQYLRPMTVPKEST